MAREPEIPEDDGGAFITSFIFKAKNIPAALYKALGGFATNGINITKLESYLLEGKFVSAQFYAEIESHPSRKAFQNAFDELKFFSEPFMFWEHTAPISTGICNKGVWAASCVCAKIYAQ